MIDGVLGFLNGGQMPEGWNETIIALMSKVPKSELVKDSRLISLCNVLYKLVSKVLANKVVSSGYYFTYAKCFPS